MQDNIFQFIDNPRSITQSAVSSLPHTKYGIFSSAPTQRQIVRYLLSAADFFDEIDPRGENETCRIIRGNLIYIAKDHLSSHSDTPLNDAEKKCIVQVTIILADLAENGNLDMSLLNHAKENLLHMSEVMDYYDLWSWAQRQTESTPPASDNEKIDYCDELEEKIRDLEDDELAVHLIAKAYDPHCNYWKELDKLVGLQSVKDQLKKQIASFKLQQERQRKHPDIQPSLSFNCIFLGNPGTGKTTVARLLSGVLRQEGLLSSGHYIETKSSDLISPWVGQSAKNAQLAAYKSVDGLLFIDEAYALAGREGNRASAASDVIDTLTPILENYRHRLCVVLAGYTKEMTIFLSETNTGFASRFQNMLSFENYSGEEMMQIFYRMASSNHYNLTNEVLQRMSQVWQVMDNYSRYIPSFANARCVRNYFEKMVAQSAIRIEAERNQGGKADVDTFSLADTELSDAELLSIWGIVKPKTPSQQLPQEDYISHLNRLLSLLTGHHLEATQEMAPSKPVGLDIASDGIILTDVKKLCVKFFGSLTQNTQEGEVYMPDYLKKELLYPYIEQMRALGNNYLLLDVSADEYAARLRKDSAWTIYSQIVDEFAQENQVSAGALFIIGGQDVIPSPVVTNPIYAQVKEQDESNYREHDIEADVLYGFMAEYIAMDDNLNLDFQLLLQHTPYLAVGRLPIEDGFLTQDRTSEVLGYFSRALQEFTKSGNYTGISIANHFVTACESCRKVANIMMDGISLMPLPQKDGLIENNMFVSPQLQVDGRCKDAELVKDNTTAGSLYSSAITQADMMTFILHGSHTPDADGYYGEDYEKTKNTVAFNPALFVVSPAKVVSGICCWGARYIGYRTENSALLSALAHKVLLFAGACRSAYGLFDKHFEKQVPHISFAEKLIANYNRNLLSGVPAGLAMLNAKIECLNEAEDADCLAYDLCTFLEFNLYGDPMLHVSSQHPSAAVFRPIHTKVAPSALTNITYETEFVCADKPLSLLEQMRSYTDSNLRYNRKAINTMLYEQLGLDPKNLSSVITVKKSGMSMEIIHHYCHRDTVCPNHTMVRMNINGDVMSIISTI